MRSKRRWLGLRVWVAGPDGTRHNGTSWWQDETSVHIREDALVGLRAFPTAAEGTGWGFADGAPSAACRPAGVPKAKGTRLNGDPMHRELTKRLMHEWDRAGLLPEPLVALLSALFPKPPAEEMRVHLAAFAWWRTKPPDKFELMRLALLLHRIDLEKADKDWMSASIRKADAFDDDVEAVLRA